MIWELEEPQRDEFIDVYSAQYVTDVDSDDVPDVLAAHTSSHKGKWNTNI